MDESGLAGRDRAPARYDRRLEAMQLNAVQIVLIAMLTAGLTVLVVEQLRDPPSATSREAVAPASPGAHRISEVEGAVAVHAASGQPAALAGSSSAEAELLSDLRARVAQLEQSLAREAGVEARRPVVTEELPANREALRDFVLGVVASTEAERSERERVEAKQEQRAELALSIRALASAAEDVELLDYEVEALVDIALDIDQRRSELQAAAELDSSDLEALEQESRELEGELRRRIEQQLGVPRTTALFGEE